MGKRKKLLLRAETRTPDEVKKEGIDYELLTHQVSRLEKELALRSGAFSNEIIGKTLTTADIRSRLKTDEALVDVVRIRYREPLHGFRDSVLYIAIVIKPSAPQPEIVLLPEGKKWKHSHWLFTAMASSKPLHPGE